MTDVLARVGQNLQASLESNVRAFAAAVLKDLIAETPKLSGQATANWQVSVDEYNDVFIEVRPRDEFDFGAVEDALTHGLSIVETYRAGQTLIIFNNAPYITSLNEGYSRQAGAGFVEAIIDRHKTLLSAINLGA